MELVTLVAMLAVTEYVLFTIATARARGRSGLEAPAVSGNEEFERYFRVQQNTVELLVAFLPALYATGYFVDDVLAAAVGLVFVVGRGIYFVEYTRDPASHRPGVMISFAAIYVLCLAGFGGALVAALGTL